jgi:hypothetical protein
MLFDEIGKNSEHEAYASDYEYMAKAALKWGDIDEAAHIYRNSLSLIRQRPQMKLWNLAKAYYDAKSMSRPLPTTIEKLE